MSTQIFETAIEFVGGATPNPVPIMGDAVIGTVCLLLTIMATAAGIGLLAYRRKRAVALGSSVASAPSKGARIAAILAIAVALLLACAAILPAFKAFAADAGRQVNATVTDKVTATVDADGNVSIESGAIANADDILAIGIRQVSTESAIDLSDAVLKVKLGDKEIYSAAIGEISTLNDYVTVPKSASSELTFELAISAEKAASLVGASAIPFKTVVDVVSAPAGKVVDAEGEAVADAKVTATYEDPYTEKERTFETTTDANGTYKLEPMRYGTSGEIEVVDSNGYVKKGTFTANENQAIDDIQMVNYLKFTAQADDSSVTPNIGSGSWQYSTNDGTTWDNGDNEGSKPIQLAKIGDSVLLRQTGESPCANMSFDMEGKIAASGSVTSLTDGNGCGPNVKLTESCYEFMFYYCTSLTQAPELPAMKLDKDCYQYMFYGCTSLTQAPELPATQLAEGCYDSMFCECTSLTQAPELPAIQLAKECYADMFYGCTNLVQAPELPATNLADSCYSNMFYGCTSLTQAPELPVTELAEGCYDSMFSGCTLLAAAPELPAETLAKECYYRMFSGCTSLTQAPELPATVLAEGCYSVMFSGCTALATAPELSATTLFASCYSDMFYGCTSLTQAPELPATELAEGCYQSMFSGCTSLTQAPVLKAESLAGYCCRYMFSGCISLTQAPELRAIQLAKECYTDMFYGCTNLVQAPELPATNLANWCYFSMFEGCTNLVQAPKLPATELAEGCYQSMFFGCTSLKVKETDSDSGEDPNKMIFKCPNCNGSDVNTMFYDTGGSFKGTPTKDKFYYWYLNE